jgi:hypothetical protein
MTLSETLQKLNQSNIETVTDKEVPKRYLSMIYEPIIGGLKLSKFRMLEIGIRDGASIQLWLNHFPNLELVGIDCDTQNSLNLNKMFQKYENCTLIFSDAYSTRVTSSLDGKFDVMVDDGPHSLESQVTFIREYLSKLNDNGFMFIEDIQAKHWIGTLINSASRNFHGCIRFIDLRELTGVGDAMVLIIHNCVLKHCNLKLPQKNINTYLMRSVFRINIYFFAYLAKRLLRKLTWKLRWRLISK